jgi:hypothetical protein
MLPPSISGFDPEPTFGPLAGCRKAFVPADEPLPIRYPPSRGLPGRPSTSLRHPPRAGAGADGRVPANRFDNRGE